MTYEECFNKLKSRILTLTDWAWEGYPLWNDISNWLQNFKGLTGNTVEQEQIHALFILSEFLYFGNKQIRALLHALFRDHFLIPLIQKIRENNNNTRDIKKIKYILKNEIGKTRFLGIGNPSESGTHLLYFFRQENGLPPAFFWDISNILKIIKDSDGKYITEITNPKIIRYVFIDDMCGTGDTTINFSKNILSKIKEKDDRIEFYYLALFGTVSGLEKIRRNTVFKENSLAIFELDSSYQLLSKKSRYIENCPELIDKKIISQIVTHYGIKLWKEFPYGYGNNQLILGMHHNIPNNTIPIIWYEDENNTWKPIFKRYVKVKGIQL